MTYSFAGIAHSLLGHRWYYEKPGQRVCKGCHMAQACVKGKWRSLGVIIGWQEPVSGRAGESIKHSKTGNEYVILLPAQHTETGEWLAVYVKRSLASRLAAWLIVRLLGRPLVWARPTAMLNETVRVPILPGFENGPEKWAARFVKIGTWL